MYITLNPFRKVAYVSNFNGNYQFVLDHAVRDVRGYNIDGTPNYKFYTHFEPCEKISKDVAASLRRGEPVENIDVRVYYDGGYLFTRMTWERARKILGLFTVLGAVSNLISTENKNVECASTHG